MLWTLLLAKDSVHIAQEAGWTLGLIYTGMEDLVLIGVQTVVCPDVVSLSTDHIILAVNVY